MSTYATASDGTELDLDSLDQTFAYSGSQLITITIVYAGKTYVQTLTYSGDNVTNISNWILQP